MFTVLWKKSSEYEELLPRVAKVWLRDDRDGKVVGIRFEQQYDGDNQFLREGTVYVMNEAGKTVATYYLEQLQPSIPPLDKSHKIDTTVFNVPMKIKNK